MSHKSLSDYFVDLTVTPRDEQANHQMDRPFRTHQPNTRQTQELLAAAQQTMQDKHNERHWRLLQQRRIHNRQYLQSGNVIEIIELSFGDVHVVSQSKGL